MADIKEAFHIRFNIQIKREEAIRRFRNRVKSEILNDLEMDEDIEGIEKAVAFELGEEYQEAGDIRDYVNDNLYEYLHALEAICGYLKTNNRDEDLKVIEKTIDLILGKSELDLGITWKNGKFISAGAEELDSALVHQPLKWLRKKSYKSILEPYEKGLDHYLHSLSKPELLSDVVTDIYEALEALTKLVTGRSTKDLSANKQLFISKLGVSRAYEKILNEYIDYANEFRHATIEGKNKPQPSRNEVESFIYLTGIFLRLASQQD